MAFPGGPNTHLQGGVRLRQVVHQAMGFGHQHVSAGVLGGGVGVPVYEGPSPRKTHFQAGQRRTWPTHEREGRGWCAWM